MGWFKKTFGKALQLSNPVGQAMYAYEHLTGKDLPTAKINGQELAVSGTGADAINAGQAFEDGRKEIKANKIASNELNDDNAAFEKFKAQDFANTNADLFTPTYKRSAQLQKDTESMLSLFNTRKDQVLAAKKTPGVSQTRF